MNRKLKALAQALLSLVFLAIGIVFCVDAYGMTVLGLSGDKWVSAPTTITYTHSVRAWSSISSKDSGVEYVLYPSYSFLANDGKTYHGNQQSIFSAEDSDRNITSEDELKKHLVVDGQIYYNPENPNQSAVERPFFFFYLPLIFVVFGIFFLIGGVDIMLDIKRFFKN